MQRDDHERKEGSKDRDSGEEILAAGLRFGPRIVQTKLGTASLMGDSSVGGKENFERRVLQGTRPSKAPK